MHYLGGTNYFFLLLYRSFFFLYIYTIKKHIVIVTKDFIFVETAMDYRVNEKHNKTEFLDLMTT